MCKAKKRRGLRLTQSAFGTGFGCKTPKAIRRVLSGCSERFLDGIEHLDDGMLVSDRFEEARGTQVHNESAGFLIPIDTIRRQVPSQGSANRVMWPNSTRLQSRRSSLT